MTSLGALVAMQWLKSYHMALKFWLAWTSIIYFANTSGSMQRTARITVVYLGLNPTAICSDKPVRWSRTLKH